MKKRWKTALRCSTERPSGRRKRGQKGRTQRYPWPSIGLRKKHNPWYPLGTYNTEKDGQFWIIVPDDAREYRIGAHPEKARNIPDKAKDLIEKSKEKKGEVKE